MKPGPADRDENALLSALRSLDACALFDTAAVAAAGFTGDTLIARTPHTCVFLAKSAALDELRVGIGSEFLFPAHYFGQPLDLGGFRGYLDNTSDGPSDTQPSCQIDLPVSPERSLSFWVRRDRFSKGSFDPCVVARAAATSAVTRLANPAQVRVDPTARVLATWDACTLLRTVLGDKAGQYRLSRDEVDLAMDGCAATEKGQHRIEFDFTLTLVYTTADWMNGLQPYAHPSTVEGKQVYIRDGVGAGTNCARAWTHEPLRSGAVPGLDGSDRVARVKIEGRTCELEPAATAIRAIPGGPPKKAEPLPQVLYRADQPDLNYLGACVDYGGSWNGPGCQPAREVDVPGDTQQRWQAAAKDPNVTCALATPIVRTHLGAELQPVTSGDHCAWVEPTHQVSLTIAVLTAASPNDYRGIGETRDITVAGHPALRADHGEPDHPRWTIYASTGTDASQPGVIVTELNTFPARGSVRDTPADTTKADRLEPILADLVTHS